MSNSRISFSRTALLHGLQMTDCWRGDRDRPGFPPAGLPGNQRRSVIFTGSAADSLDDPRLCLRRTGFAGGDAGLHSFFTAPYWSLSVDDPSYWITFVIMTITAFITSTLTSKAKLNAQNALQREQEIKTMYALSRRLNEEIDIRQIARLAAEVLAGVLQAEVRCLCLDENEQPAALYGARPGQSAVPLSGDETAVNDKPDSRRAGTPSSCRCKTTAFGWQCCKFR